MALISSFNYNTGSETQYETIEIPPDIVFLDEKKIGYMYAVIVAFVLIALLVLACIYLPDNGGENYAPVHNKSMFDF